MFRKGSPVTIDTLTNFFKSIYQIINGLSNRQLSQMTSGQMAHYDSTNLVWSDPINVWSTQYFDNRTSPVANVDYFRYYKDKLERL